MRRQLVPGPVVRLTVIKAKTRPGIEANAYDDFNESLVAILELCIIIKIPSAVRCYIRNAYYSQL